MNFCDCPALHFAIWRYLSDPHAPLACWPDPLGNAITMHYISAIHATQDPK